MAEITVPELIEGLFVCGSQLTVLLGPDAASLGCAFALGQAR